jgi:hypothetical protein
MPDRSNVQLIFLDAKGCFGLGQKRKNAKTAPKLAQVGLPVRQRQFLVGISPRSFIKDHEGCEWPQVLLRGSLCSLVVISPQRTLWIEVRFGTITPQAGSGRIPALRG